MPTSPELNTFLGHLGDSSYFVYTVLLFFAWGLKCLAFHPTVFALIGFPGTLAHELAHLLAGWLLRAQPVSMTLWPKYLGQGRWQLGGVSFGYLRWWSAPWVAMAPMLLAPLAGWLMRVWFWPLWLAGQVSGSLLTLYVCATLLQAAWPSRTDFRVAAPGLLVLVLLAWLVWLR